MPPITADKSQGFDGKKDQQPSDQAEIPQADPGQKPGGKSKEKIIISLTDIQVTAIRNVFEQRKNSYKRPQPVENAVLDPGSSDSAREQLSKENHIKLTEDGEHALMTAAMFSHTGDRQYAEYCAKILLAWANTNKNFTGKNGFLASAWGVGAMARAARILKETHAPEWLEIEGPFKKWAIKTAETYWLPRDGLPSKEGATPQLLSDWENKNVSNRTFTALEATLHVAHLVDDDQWFALGIEKYKAILPKFFTDKSGKHADDFRGDPWHKQASLASATQICQLAKGKGYSLFSINENVLKTSVEYYAMEINNQYVPFWPLFVDHYGSKETPQSYRLLIRDKGSYYKWYLHGVEFLWGLGQFL